jgi:hypothetical protein
VTMPTFAFRHFANAPKKLLPSVSSCHDM